MTSRQDKMAHNEVFFRDINEQIEKVALRHGKDSHEYEFLCECSQLDCLARITMSVKSYEKLRSDSTHFAIQPGHETPDIETIHSKCDGYWVVAKFGEAGIIADQEDNHFAALAS